MTLDVNANLQVTGNSFNLADLNFESTSGGDIVSINDSEDVISGDIAQDTLVVDVDIANISANTSSASSFAQFLGNDVNLLAGNGDDTLTLGVSVKRSSLGSSASAAYM